MSLSAPSSLQFIDIGANLTDEVFKGIYRSKQAHADDFSSMIQRAKSIGMRQIIVTAGTLNDVTDALALCSSHPDILYTTVGVHPTRCMEFEPDPEGHLSALWSKIEEASVKNNADGRVVAIGECGLDYDRLEFCSREVQLKHFERQISLAERSHLPMFLHNRSTNGEFVEIIRKNRSRFTHGVVHSFTDSLEEMEQLLALDLFIGINGCSLKTAENLETVKRLPLDRLMLETDAPWCDIRNTHASSKFVKTKIESKKKEKFVEGLCVTGRNEPCTIIQVAEVVAGVKGISVQEVADAAFKNAQRVFFPHLI